MRGYVATLTAAHLEQVLKSYLEPDQEENSQAASRRDLRSMVADGDNSVGETPQRKR